MRNDVPPRLAVTLGDPAGIGPELVLRALADRDVAAACRLFVYGNHKLLMRVAEAARIPFVSDITVLPPPLGMGEIPDGGGHILYDFPFGAAGSVLPGQVQAACGQQAYQWIEAAVRDTLAGRSDALVTAPICKEALHLAGVPFPGHTEMLGHLTGVPDPCMVFHSPSWMMGLVTIHEALADVPRLLSVGRVLRTIRLTHEGCVRFRGGGAPRIGVLALNPHAGERGLFGTEEARVIIPAIEQARSEGLDVSGPLVPDTAFAFFPHEGGGAFDAYVAMYHDQGLIPFKMVAFDTGVNVTLGLPFVRTSPDHGTAFDLAWQGRANAESFLNAIRLLANQSGAAASAV
ncbi:MAG: 4-hydroxythreonine-4-phosphate dehydrogenase PdxA [Kiritimatiellaeota bacterium]|nr:4-hydroxythreonine-4-phosphate dehydrogenase PdxA [Kiritimatiellota bacterium]